MRTLGACSDGNFHGEYDRFLDREHEVFYGNEDETETAACSECGEETDVTEIIMNRCLECHEAYLADLEAEELETPKIMEAMRHEFTPKIS